MSDSNNKKTLHIIVLDDKDRLHGKNKEVDLNQFRAEQTLLDITKAKLDNVQAPLKEIEFEGKKISGHEVVQIGDLKKVYDKETNPNAEKDGFQAYLVVNYNDQTQDAGLLKEVKQGKIEYLNADQTTVEKIKHVIDSLPDNAEIKIVWRRDIQKTKDIVEVDASTSVKITNTVGFIPPKCGSCSVNGKEVKLEDGLYLFTDKGDDRIMFNSPIVNGIIKRDYLAWDAGGELAKEFEHLKNPYQQIEFTQQIAQHDSNQIFAYFEVTCSQVKEKIVELNTKINEGIETNGNVMNQKLDIQVAFADNTIICNNKASTEVKEESIIIRLLMNPTERKLWGKMYGLIDDEEARNTFSTKTETIKNLENQTNYEDKLMGRNTSNNETKIEKNETSEQPSRLMFSSLLERSELKVDEETIDDDKDESDKFGIKVVIESRPKSKKKKANKKTHRIKEYKSVSKKQTYHLKILSSKERRIKRLLSKKTKAKVYKKEVKITHKKFSFDTKLKNKTRNNTAFDISSPFDMSNRSNKSKKQQKTEQSPTSKNSKKKGKIDKNYKLQWMLEDKRKSRNKFKKMRR